jgi:T5SS/PEP-CTERM-associated repeat protein
MKRSPILFAAAVLASSASSHAQLVADGATNTLSNVTNNITGNVIVGTNGSFTLLVLSDNALVTNSLNGIIGRNSTAKSNEVRLISSAARWQMGGSLFVGSNGAMNRLVVSNGALLEDTGGNLGFATVSSNNSALVTGPASLWTNRSSFAISGAFFSSSRSNGLVVSNGAALASGGSASVGGVGNQVTVTGAGSRWANQSDFSFGGAANRLEVSDGAGLVSGSASISGFDSGDANTVLLTGTGTVWTNSTNLNIGFGGARGVLTASNGASLLFGGSVTLGGIAAANSNSVSISDPGTSWTLGADLYVGGGGAANVLTISNGGFVVSSNGVLGSLLGASGNSALVTGTGSVWSNRADLTIGSFGAGNQLVGSNGATMFAGRNGVIGLDSSASSNSFTITGPGTRWTTISNLYVGSNAPFNRLTVASGAFAVSRKTVIGSAISSSNNTVLITGAGTVWSNRNTLADGLTGATLGDFSAGNQLVVSNGGTVKLLDGYFIVGNTNTAVSNSITLTGAGTSLTVATAGALLNPPFELGYFASGNRLLVNNGASLKTHTSYVGAFFSASNTLAVLSDPGSSWTNTSSIAVGGYIGSRLVVSNAAVLNTLELGNDGDLSGDIIVSGPGTKAIVGTDLFVGFGFGRSNRLVIEDGAVLTSDDCVIGAGSLNTRDNLLLVTGSGSVLSNHSLLHISDTSDRNSMVVSNGATVYTGAATLGSSNPFTFLGDQITSEVIVTGAGSFWTNDSLFVVGGRSPRNRLVVTNQGAVSSGDGFIIGLENSTSTNNRVVVHNGTLRVTNATLTSTLDIRGGTNEFNAGLIETDLLLLTNSQQGFFEFNGGTLITRGAVIISNGLPFVVGRSVTPAIWDARSGVSNHLLAARLIVGSNSSFNQVFVTNGTILDGKSDTFLAFNSGSNNQVLVSGPGSTLNSPLGMYIGADGNANRMQIGNGGKVFATNSAAGTFIGRSIGTRSNVVVVADPGSRWSVNDILYVGSGGNANSLIVSNGATVDSLIGYVGSGSFASNNFAIVTGANSSWSNRSEFYVGSSGSGNRLFVSDGGTVINSNAYLGFDVSSRSNAVQVSGAGSFWNNRADLFVGYDGTTNELTVSNGATVSVLGNLLIGRNPTTSSGNRLVVDNGTLLVTNATATGLLEIRRGTDVLNAGLIEVDTMRMTNAPQSKFEFNGGTLSARSSKIFSGTILSIGNGTDQATMILAGNGTHDFGGNLQTRISSNAVLTGNGAMIGAISILSGGKLFPGFPLGGIGKIIFTNSPSLQGTVAMEISKNGAALTNDQVQVIIGTLTYGGALVVSNLGPTALATGDRFQLFNATNYAGSFSSTSLPPLAAGLDWTNKLLVDGSIEVITPTPAERFWTNLAGGNYDVAANWLSNAVPFPQDTANFSSNASYQVVWPTSALSANAVFNAGGGTVIQAIANSLWTLTNSFVVGRDSAGTAAVTHVTGRLSVTNSAATARMIVGQGGHGTYNLNGGEVVADTLLATNVGKSVFNFTSGTLRTRSTTVANGSQFVIGNGVSPATFELLGNGAHNLSLIVSSNAILIGNGTLVGGVDVQGGGVLIPGAGGTAPAVGKIIFSNAPSLQGTVIMEISKNGLVLTNDLIQAAGTFFYGGALIVSNLGPTALANGDKFQLFTATSFAGAFTSLDLPPLGAGLNWKTNLLLDGSIEVFAPPALPLSHGSYTQNFDSLAMSGINPWRDNSTLLGWYAAKSTVPNPVTTYFASDGNGPDGSLYSFGSAGSAERALGSVASGSFGDVAYGLCFTNDTANSVSNFMITYTGEQWRSAGGMSVSNTLTFWYRLSPSVITNPEPGIATMWIQVTNLEFGSPKVLGGFGVTALDGNEADNRHVFSSVLIPGLVVPPGQHVFFRWHDLDDPGADQGMALDDLIVTFASPAPQITSIIVSPANGSVQISGQGVPNQTYALEAATNLSPPIFWQRLDTNTADGFGLYQLTDPNAAAFPMRFYRVLLP